MISGSIQGRSLLASMRSFPRCRLSRGLRWCSTGARRVEAPTLSILSWAVDGSLHSHHRCRRRLTVAERTPGIVQTVIQCAPDVVALQDSTPAIAEEICNINSGGNQNEDIASSLSSSYVLQEAGGVVDMLMLEAEPPVDAAPVLHENDCLRYKDAPPGLSYVLVGRASNGRCGELQVFAKVSSLWKVSLLPSSPGVTVELRANTHTSAPNRCVLSNIDLSYRGRSLAVGGTMLTSPDVSLNGSPFTLAAADGAKKKRDRGEMDPHRAVALDFLSRVTQPDIIVGNTFMGQNEKLQGYEESAAGHLERTTNTCRAHQQETTSNYYYFVPSGGVRRSPAALKRGKATQPQHSDGDSKEDNTANKNTEAVRDSHIAIGDQIPLNAGRAEENEEQEGAANAIMSAEGTDGFVHAQLQAEKLNPHTDQSRVGVPEVSGRFQRCFMRRYGSRTNTRQRPFSANYSQHRVAVPKPLVSAPPLGPIESKWQCDAIALKGVELDEVDKGIAPVMCSVSDQFPILVMLTNK